MADFTFISGQSYKKSDIYKICHVPTDKQKGNWNTGYTQWNGDWFIFCNIGTAGRTGHDYANRFENELLHWYGKTASHVDQDSIKSLLSRQNKVHVFYRTDDRSPFKYAGEASPHSHKRTSPVQITWSFQKNLTQTKHANSALNETPDLPMSIYNKQDQSFPEELSGGTTYPEGAIKQIYVNAFERNAKAVSDCKAHYGTSCVVCGFDFGKIYGELGQGYIHVHHLVQLADISKEYKVDPIKDLRPVCPNCHSMLHQRRPPLSIEELKKIIGLN
ncbi:HNH endonuclease [Rheinheimera sp.]|uniref:HNH endonuclease n=1 Tax=Rheinheimera sp. TaxID=1869214 RepID=UPI002FDE8F4A